MHVYAFALYKIFSAFVLSKISTCTLPRGDKIPSLFYSLSVHFFFLFYKLLYCFRLLSICWIHQLPFSFIILLPFLLLIWLILELPHRGLWFFSLWFSTLYRWLFLVGIDFDQEIICAACNFCILFSSKNLTNQTLWLLNFLYLATS